MRSPPLYLPARPQSVGEVLDSGFRIFQATLLKSLPWGVLVVIAGQLASIRQLATAHSLRAVDMHDPAGLAWDALGEFAAFLLFGALVLEQDAASVDHSSAVVTVLRAWLARLPCLVAPALVATAVSELSRLASLALDFASPAWTLGCLLLLVLLAYLAIPLLFALVAVSLGPLGPLAALTHSMRLVSGNWWRMTLAFSVAFIVILVFYAVVAVVVALVVPSPGGLIDVSAASSISAVADVAFGPLAVPFMSAMALAAFGELKVRREGLDLERRIDLARAA